MTGSFKTLADTVPRILLCIIWCLLVYFAKDTIVQLRTIQQDLVNIKIKLSVMESKAVTKEEVRELIEHEVSRYHK